MGCASFNKHYYLIDEDMFDDYVAGQMYKDLFELVVKNNGNCPFFTHETASKFLDEYVNPKAYIKYDIEDYYDFAVDDYRYERLKMECHKVYFENQLDKYKQMHLNVPETWEIEEQEW